MNSKPSEPTNVGASGSDRTVVFVIGRCRLWTLGVDWRRRGLRYQRHVFLGKALKFAGFSLEMCSKPPAAEKLQARLGLRGLAPIMSRPTAKARNI
jgi:hypothetical protein